MRMAWLAAAAVLCGTSTGWAQDGAGRFALLPFENTGSYGQDKEVFEALQVGLPAMLARAIGRHPGAEAVEGQRLDRAMRAANLGPSQRVDAAGAAAMGKATGSRYAVTGSFADFYGKFRVNARVVDARTGEIIKVVSNDDPKLQDRAQLASIVQSVAERIVAAAGLAAFPAGAAPPPVPTDAITAYSRGLLHESRGDRAKAREFYQAAVTAFPQFDEARSALARVSGS